MIPVLQPARRLGTDRFRVTAGLCLQRLMADTPWAEGQTLF